MATTNGTRLAELEEREREAWRLCVAVQEIASRLNHEHALAEIALAEARGEVERVTWLRLSLDPEATSEAKHAAYIRLQAKNTQGRPEILSVLPEPDRSEVAAEVERMRAEAPRDLARNP